MKMNAVAVVRKDAQHVIFSDIAVECQEGGRAIVHDDMRFGWQFGNAVDQSVKLAWIDVAVFQDVQTVNIKLFEASQGGVHRVSVKSHDLFAQMPQRLEQDSGDHGFTHAPLALLDEMNGCHSWGILWLNSFFGAYMSRGSGNLLLAAAMWRGAPSGRTGGAGTAFGLTFRCVSPGRGVSKDRRHMW